MEHYAVLAGFALETAPQDRGIGAPPPVSGADADRLAAAPRPAPRERVPATARWQRRVAAALATAAHDGARRRTWSGRAGAAREA
ncbi:hypothetical protein [Streptomyces lonarensis]|uniref:hypothetical protein n=1 Tax=Streptomyces lonarensis TaxID=700599 RepID=UPI0030C6F625